MKKKKLNSFTEFFELLTPEERTIYLILDDIIIKSIPNINKKLSYNVPFYKLNKNICFIWPSSIIWGKKKTYEGVRLGFNFGYLLNAPELNLGNRKFVAWMDFKTVAEIDVALIIRLLSESVKIESSFNKVNS